MSVFMLSAAKKPLMVVICLFLFVHEPVLFHQYLFYYLQLLL